MFASVYQLYYNRPGRVDDIYSLLCVAYYFAYGTLPWIEHIDNINQECPEVNMYSFAEFRQMRKRNWRMYD